MAFWLEAEGRPSLNLCLQHYGCGTDCMVCKCKKKIYKKIALYFHLDTTDIPMSLSCYHGEEGSTPEGRDARFKTEEWEQNRTLSEILIFFVMHKLTHHPKDSAMHTMHTIKYLPPHITGNFLEPPAISMC